MDSGREVKRSPSDHGTALDAINFILDSGCDVVGEEAAFLRSWREGDLGEWPEFYVWLDQAGEATIQAIRARAALKVDVCVKDGHPCYVGADTDDAHWRCGTVACGMRAALKATERSDG